MEAPGTRLRNYRMKWEAEKRKAGWGQTDVHHAVHP